MTASASVSLDAPTTGDIPFRLLVLPFPPNHFTVRSFRGREEISGLYRFDVVVTCPEIGEGAVETLALGQRAILLLHVGKAPRVFQGLISSVKHEGVRASHGAAQYRLRLVPRLWLLKQKRKSRIFQNMQVADVVKAVLAESRIESHFQLQHTYPVREYITQYEETDYQFIRRLIGESGIFFRYAQGSGLVAESIASALDLAPGIAGAAALLALGKAFTGEKLIFADESAAYPPIDDGSLLGAAADALDIPTTISANVGGFSASADIHSPTLFYLTTHGGSHATYDKVTRFEPERRVRTNAAAYREYDPTRPMAMITTGAHAAEVLNIFQADASVSANAGVQANAFVNIAAIAKEALGPLLESPELEYYEHHAPFLFPKWKFAEQEPSLILEQRRRNASTVAGESLAPSMACGYRFRLEDHPTHLFNRSYAVTSVVHEGWTIPPSPDRETYRNRFTCVPAEVIACLPRPKRRSVMVALTATVVGPGQEEIHTEPLGQIKVQFHWDRQGKNDDHSSCWIRTMHAWGGAGYGTQFIPRIGMEVVVTFEGGDPDKPMVLGCLYNGTHPPSFRLPEDKTRSGIRTQSSPGGNGYNELSFEDRKGEEQVYLRAERDLDEEVLRDHTLDVKRDETIHVGGNRRDEVVGDAHARVRGSLEEEVLGSQTTTVIGHRMLAVRGNDDVRISGASATRVDGREKHETSRQADFVYGDDLTIKVRGCETIVVGREAAERSYLVHTFGVAKMSSTGALEITSDKEITLRCGKSTLRMTDSGIELDTPSLLVKGGTSRFSVNDEGLKLKSESARAEIVGGNVLLKTNQGASVGLGAQVQVAGSQILLNSPSMAKDDLPPEPGPKTAIELVDQQGKPLAHQRYLLVLDDGSEQSGILDGEGKAEVDVGASGKIFFPDLDQAREG
ncbi:MAG TPA: type VI secretion system tip protein TssI/VgrG [Polyangium sp.]|nr:type VI secretion system tip protein TssI/VgrG [Polyangium sp.]